MLRMLILTVAVLLSGCQAVMYGTAKDMTKVSIGMTRADVIQALGSPTSIAADRGVEYLIYKKMAAVATMWPVDYFVKVEEGRVTAIGEKGDFGSTKDPTLNINVNGALSPPKTSPEATGQGRVDALERLYRLKQSGAISQQEYEREKSKLLN